MALLTEPTVGTVFTQLRRGDVIFTRAPGKSAIASIFVQKTLLDPLASQTPRGFSHVSLALDNVSAIEAVPIFDIDENGQIVLERGGYTGIELRYGVRFIPNIDLLLPSSAPGASLAVLRPQTTEPIGPEVLDFASRTVVELAGSEYSLDFLKDTAEASIGFALPNLLRDKMFDWTSPAEDLATRTGVDAELRAQIVARGFAVDLPGNPRTFFCSSLVGTLLEASGLLSPGSNHATPTGLYALLSSQPDRWTDVTSAAASPQEQARLAAQNIDSIASAHVHRRLLLAAQRNLTAVAAPIGIIKGFMDEMNRKSDDILGRLEHMRSGPKDPGPGSPSS